MLQNKEHIAAWGELGRHMRALSNDRQRAFVRFFVTEKPGLGAATRAARRAGYCAKNPHMARKAAYVLSHDPKILKAIEEEAIAVIRLGAPEAARALMNLVRNDRHKDHARGVGMLLDRVYPVMTVGSVEVTHKVVSPDEEALEELRALRQLGTSRMKLLELFGPNGLDRLERMEARRAENAKVIDSAANEVVGGDDEVSNG
jgi:phage terminase small subunit